jgi:hypothetical protein
MASKTERTNIGLKSLKGLSTGSKKSHTVFRNSPDVFKNSENKEKTPVLKKPGKRNNFTASSIGKFNEGINTKASRDSKSPFTDREPETTPSRFTPIKMKCHDFLKTVQLDRDKDLIQNIRIDRSSSSLCNVSGVKNPISSTLFRESKKSIEETSDLSSNDRMSQVDENIETVVDPRMLQESHKKTAMKSRNV